MEMITSKKNPLLKAVRKLLGKAHRETTGLCLVEGIQPSLRVMDNGLPIELAIFAPEMLKSDIALARIGSLQQQGVRVVAASKEAFATISERENPVGLALVAQAKPLKLDSLPIKSDSILTALFDIKNPGNLGTIVRTVDSIGGSGVILIGQTADPYDPDCIKASMGTVFGVPIAKTASPLEFLNFCQERGISILTTSAEAPDTLAKTVFTYPCAVLMGSEGSGLPDDLLQCGTWAVSIPMYGQATSLNLSVATGIVLYEVKKQLSTNRR